MTLSIVTLASGIDSGRLTRVIRTWDVPGVESIVVVRGKDQELALRQLYAVPFLRQVIPASNVPFSRATWRNIGLRFAPPGDVLFIDADCALVRPGAIFDIEVILGSPGGDRRLVVLPPAWSTQEAAERFLAASRTADALSALEGVSAKRPDATHAGTCALSHDLAIEVSWDDNLDQGWGYEDDDFCRRALLHAEQASPVHIEGLVHVWHPPRGRSRQSKIRNRQIALARDKAPSWCETPESAVTYLRTQWYVRAEREIAQRKLPASVFEAVLMMPEDATEVDVRRHVAKAARDPALLRPDSQYLPYGPVEGASLMDWSRGELARKGDYAVRLP